MNTTAVLVDILIIGFQVLLWISGLLFSFIFPYNSALNLMEKSPVTFLFFIVAISYTLGIIFDYIIANFFRHFKSKEEKETYREGLVIDILSFDIEIQKFLDNQYARLRIVRATIYNLPLITIATCCFVFNNLTPLKLSVCQTIFAILIIGIILTIFAIIGWKQRNKVYWGYIKQTLKTLDESKKNK